jgi:subtilase family serine protease
MSARRFVLSATGALALLALVAAIGVSGASASAPSRAPANSGAVSTSVLKQLSSRYLDVTGLASASSQAPTDAQCRAQAGQPCYSPQEIEHAYGVDQLLNRGDNGKGQTIVIIDSFGSPTLRADLANFDEGYGLQAPPSLKILSPLGTVPFDPTTTPDQVNWAAETTLDVEWSHAMAPAAKIVLLTSPVDETEGVQGLPQFDFLLNYALKHHLGHVISESWGATENTLFTPGGQQVFNNFENTYARAAAQGVTAFASTGDSGASNAELNGTSFYPFPTVGFPASSPLVTAVGGTSLTADTSGNYESETVWNSGGGAGGGGVSQVFREPFYERVLPRSVQNELGGSRGIPDISWDADPSSGILIYLSFLGPTNAGYYFIGGTSEGSPQWAGLVSDLNQFLHHPIGFLNPYLYALGAAGVGFHDVTVGNNSLNGVTGYDATPGWDLATGWGTPNLAQLFSDISSLARGSHSMNSMVARARALR